MEKQKEVPFTPDELRHFRWLFPNGFFTKIVRVITNAILRSPRLTEFVKEIVKETLAEQAVTVKPKATRPTKKSTTAVKATPKVAAQPRREVSPEEFLAALRAASGGPPEDPVSEDRRAQIRAAMRPE